MADSKSVLDGVPVSQDENFKKLMSTKESIGPHPSPPLFIVGSCPRCGAPIYGVKTTAPGVVPPAPQYTCSCRFQHKSFTETIEKK